MSEQSPPETGEKPLPAFDAPVAAGRSRAARSLVAAAAAVVVLGGASGSLLWLSSAPGIDEAGAVAVAPGARATPEVTPTGEPGPGTAFAFNGRDLFANTVGPRDAAGAPAATTEAPAGAPAAPAVTAPIAVPPVVTVVPVPSPTSTTTTAWPTPGSGPTVAPAPTAQPTAQPTPATPTPSRSTAPAWEISSYRYLGADPENPCGTNFQVHYSENHGGYCQNLADGAVLYPADITFRGDVGGNALITSNRGIRQGWLVPAEQQVPSAAMGASHHVVRSIGVLGGSTYFFQVDRGSSVKVSVDELIPGTTFTFLGLEYEGLEPPGMNFFVKDADGVVWYGSFGGTEDDGILF
ncbi:hypothetical protein [Kineococcus gypseus]|uniref:hypothetical protein n=1 Tax=Kineococcus gypseus TaxID=1637102 RepID=UPI003D7E35FA